MKEMSGLSKYAFSNARSKMKYTHHYNCYVYLVYSIVKKRLEKGYSAEDLSFLLGKPVNYFTAIEALKEEELGIEELELLRLIFQCEMKEFFKFEQKIGLIAVGTRKIKAKNCILYEIFTGTIEGTGKLLYSLREELTIPNKHIENIHIKPLQIH